MREMLPVLGGGGLATTAAVIPRAHTSREARVRVRAALPKIDFRMLRRLELVRISMSLFS